MHKSLYRERERETITGRGDKGRRK